MTTLSIQDELRMVDQGYWYSFFTGTWYQKVYKNKEIYNWVPVANTEDIELLEMGIIPELETCGYDIHQE